MKIYFLFLFFFCPFIYTSSFYFYLTHTSILSSGGASRDRTDDPLLAKQMLSQLSYSPGPPFGGIENGGIEN